MIKAKGCRSQREELRGPLAGSLGDGRQLAARSPRGGSPSAAELSAGKSAPTTEHRIPKGQSAGPDGQRTMHRGDTQSAAVQVLYHKTRE